MADTAETNTGATGCGSCGKTHTKLQRCSRCQSERYCNRDCQKAHWKTHKKVCSTRANAAAAAAAAGGSTSNSNSANNNTHTQPTAKNLDVYVPNPFTRLDNGTWLHDRSERDTYKLLIDAYRMRAEDDYNYEGDVDMDSVMSGEASTSIRPFKRFLTRIENRKRDLLPDWWNKEKRLRCERTGLNSNNWEDLGAAPEKGDFIEHYEDPRMPMQLRMFAEDVYGRGPGGMNGTAMRKAMMVAEAGEGHMATIDMINGHVAHGV
ncbi:putative MYND domain protein [Phyllosticta citrichinensis]|uniref:MYND domain protein n=1 Tax=Phyllosticta citrichinensis TaxID=1130410 RepID=A0ABR1XH30_9PEZI